MENLSLHCIHAEVATNSTLRGSKEEWKKRKPESLEGKKILAFEMGRLNDDSLTSQN